MPYLKKIVGYINNELKEQVNCESSLIIGIAQSLPRMRDDGIELIPSYVNNDGEGKYVGPDDNYDLIIYHRVNRIGVGPVRTTTYGDDMVVNGHTAMMSLVVFGRRDVLRKTNDELAIILDAGFPVAATKEMLNELDFKAANINVKEIILNDMQVFQEEFTNVKYFLKPEQFLLKINYTIESAFLKRCFKKCK